MKREFLVTIITYYLAVDFNIYYLGFENIAVKLFD